MAVNTMATMAIRMEVTTWPWPSLLKTPYAGMGAVGWITIMPYMIRSQSVSERFRRGVSTDGLAAELIHDLKTKPHYPAEITGFGEGSTVAREAANGTTLPQFHKIPLEFYTERIFCQ